MPCPLWSIVSEREKILSIHGDSTPAFSITSMGNFNKQRSHSPQQIAFLDKTKISANVQVMADYKVR